MFFMRYYVANKMNLKKYGKTLLDENYSDDKMKELLKCKTLDDFNNVLNGFGVEYVRSISGENDFEYVNVGDSYALTIVDYKGKLRITSDGDILENNMNDFE